MRYRLFPIAVAGIACIALFARIPQPIDHSLSLINRLDELVQARFQSPAINALGMSRVAVPSSFGRHFSPRYTAQRDFAPENAAEKEVIQQLEDNGLQVGLYVFGAAILDSAPDALDFRALKGPGAMTSGTPRPSWYPALAQPAAAQPDALPDWKAIYPLARQAMQTFQEGGGGFETVVGSWTVAARPVIAGAQRCVDCHNNPAFRPRTVTKLNQPLGGVLYAFRRPIR